MVWGNGESFIYSFSDPDSGDLCAFEPSPVRAWTGAALIVSSQSSTVRGLDLEKSARWAFDPVVSVPASSGHP